MCYQVKVKIQFLLGGPINQSLKEKGPACAPLAWHMSPCRDLNHWWMELSGPVLH